jgi:hypothetical protein
LANPQEVPMVQTMSKFALRKVIKERNSLKPRWNLARISKFIHILIFEFLEAKEIFKISMVSRSLLKASKEPGVWEIYFPDKKRMRHLIQSELATAQKSIPPKEPRSVKEILMQELNVAANLTSRNRYQTFNLIGHSKMISALDIKGRIVVSGGRDNSVKVWDI